MELILGPPGTGKTTTLLTIMEKEIEAGVDPSEIAFVSFTRKGAYEARDRVIQHFGFRPHELPYFRTLHSIAFRSVGATRARILGRNHFNEIGAMTGVPFRGYVKEDDPMDSAMGDKILFLIGYARNTVSDLYKVWD